MGTDSEAEKSAQKEKKKLLALAPIAKPLAGKKLNKRIFKLVRRGIFHMHIYMWRVDLYMCVCVCV